MKNLISLFVLMVILPACALKKSHIREVASMEDLTVERFTYLPKKNKSSDIIVLSTKNESTEFVYVSFIANKPTFCSDLSVKEFKVDPAQIIVGKFGKLDSISAKSFNDRNYYDSLGDIETKMIGGKVIPAIDLTFSSSYKSLRGKRNFGYNITHKKNKTCGSKLVKESPLVKIELYEKDTILRLRKLKDKKIQIFRKNY